MVTIFLVNLILTASYSGSHWELYVGLANVSIVGFGVSHALRLWAKKRHWYTPTRIHLWPHLVPALLVAPLIWMLISVPINIYLYQGLPTYRSFTVGFALVIYLQFFAVLAMWLALYSVIKLLRANRQQKEDGYRLEIAKREAQLLALRSQINPHFLFNALNSIRAMILEDRELSRIMVSKLSAIFRYTLSLDKRQKVTLAEEIAVSKDYIALERIRFEERLSVNWLCDDNDQWLVPPMVLQSLIENAIKHGIAQLPNGGCVDVKISETASSLSLSVENPVAASRDIEPEGTGSGQPHIRQRLALIYGQAAQFHTQIKHHVFTAMITLPKEIAHD